MDPYLIYLLVVNALAFLLLSIDYHVCMRTGREELIDHRILSVFALIGGGIGMLVAFLVWDRRVNKNNVAWRLMAVIGIVAWALVTLCVYGVIKLDVASLVAPLDLGDLVPFGVYLLVANLVTLALFSFQGNWNDFMWPLMVTNRPETRTLAAGLSTFIERYSHQYARLPARGI